MGSYLGSATTTPRQPRRLATTAIGLVAVIGLVTACTASSVGAARRAPDRYPAGASVQSQGQAKAATSADSPQSLRLEKQARRAMSATAGKTRTANEYELMRSEHQPGK